MPVSTDTFEKKNSIVTGGAGFIGSHLCEALLEEGRVICIDDLSNGTTDNIEHLLANPDFVFIKHNIATTFELEALAELERCKINVQGIQEIFHCACPMSVLRFRENRIAILEASSSATKVTLDWAVKYKARYIFTSSSCVYGGRMDDAPLAEDAIGTLNHLSDRAAYDEGKRFAETMIETYRDVCGVDARIARLFRTYGPRLKMNDKQMITEFVASALDNAPLVIYGDPTFRTTLLYIADAISGLLKVSKAQPGLGAINLGAEQEYAFVEIAEKVKQMTGSTAAVNFDAPLDFLSEHPVPDISYAKQSLGWMPLMPLENGLQHMIDFVSANRHKISYSV